MTAYRKHEPSADDVETDALRDLVARMKRLRRKTALPVLAIAMTAAWVGMSLHALGYWSVIGSTSNFYYVSSGTFAVAALICAAPILLPGIALYVVLRGRLRDAWMTEHRKLGASEDFLERSSRRYG